MYSNKVISALKLNTIKNDLGSRYSFESETMSCLSLEKPLCSRLWAGADEANSWMQSLANSFCGLSLGPGRCFGLLNIRVNVPTGLKAERTRNFRRTRPTRSGAATTSSSTTTTTSTTGGQRRPKSVDHRSDYKKCLRVFITHRNIWSSKTCLYEILLLVFLCLLYQW